MSKEFIPYEQALQLKELGFDEDVFEWYDTETKDFCDVMKEVKAPLYQQAFRWFRKKHGLHGIYTMGDDWNNFYWQVWKNDCMTKTYVCSSDYVFETYEEAELACLNKLIEIVKGGEQ